MKQLKMQDLLQYCFYFQVAALWILVFAIAYLKHPESHISQLEENITERNITLYNIQKEEQISKVVQKATLSEYLMSSNIVLLLTSYHLHIAK